MSIVLLTEKTLDILSKKTRKEDMLSRSLNLQVCVLLTYR